MVIGSQRRSANVGVDEESDQLLDVTMITRLLSRVYASRTRLVPNTMDDANTSPEVMLQFYRMLYPFKSIFTWLNHEHVPTKLFTHREFAFTLQGDVYLRYHSFNTADELKKQVLALNPTRFEIGPVYSARVRVLFDRRKNCN